VPPDLIFPPGFRWGTGTSAHQVEGQLTNDWSNWEQTPGKVRDGSDSSRTCQWWSGRYLEDFDLAQSMSQNALRFSVEWSRIEPQEGEWDSTAISRYRDMLGALRERGIEPMATLFHFTSPLWLARKGGWENEASARYFERFATKAVDAFGDLVDVWCTINEPSVYAVYSYLLGIWPPQKGSFLATLRVLRHQLLAHARAYRAIHRVQPAAKVGLAQHLRVFDPFRPNSALDRWAASLQDRGFNQLALDFPAKGVLSFPLGLNTTVTEAVDSQDYIGLNYYSRDMVTFDIRQPGLLFTRRFPMPGAEFSMEGWGEIYPEGLYRLLKRLESYGKPIYVTETGVPDNDDSKRPRMLLTHLAAVHRALSEGVPVKGFYFWSLVDNFEWADGFSARFGLVHLDLPSGQRTLKRSGNLYGEICRAGAITVDMVERYAPEVKQQLFLRSPPG
jgi:beta-glucosidase